MMKIEQFQEIVRQIRPKLVAYANRLTKYGDEAEDLVQEVLIRLWLSREQLEKYENMEAVAMKALKNKMIDEFRKKKIESEQLNNQQIEGKSPDGLQTLETKEKLQLLIATIEKLPNLQRMIIKLKDVEGYEVEEIAMITQTSQESVRMNLSRARKRVRELFIPKNIE
ncbi:sigma-70 family RNA polymerase sigma factor [Bacteroidales bacterium OttesenSCG-928-B11]|nr:sigma-70 family RNA polymerase sigma factor [Bacteroidales bacterium OttesenSCG-928-E04]MDL2309182.1 sigma-70 family RNA polymerase sigma factor [Bacteroidales bacterium OttesenSCG-928-C03]MDL2312058.1 sigma-70 family RNA polymerase sigma factor [Bacteroidales bacterium OttesenSCG-928-B11]